MATIRLSQMTPYEDRGIHEGMVVEVRAGGLAGGADRDLYLAIIDWANEEDEYPDVLVDCDEIAT